jgi:HSP20 family protein
MNLIPWSRRHQNGGTAHPLDLFRRQMDRLFEDFFGDRSLALTAGSGEFVPRLEVSETEKEVVVKAELPGLKQDDVEVNLTGGRLVISGQKKDEREEKDRSYHLVERSYGSFSRAVDLGEAVDAEKASASFKDGVLTVTVGKAAGAGAKKIKVSGD